MLQTVNAGPPGPPAAEPAPPPPAESESPSPYYSPPPGGPGPVTTAPRSRGPLVAIIVVVVLLIVAVLGYGGGGWFYAQGRLNSATDAYNGVVAHQNSLNDTVRSLNAQLTSTDFATASSSNIQQAKTTVAQMVTNSQNAQPQIASDDAALAAAQDSLTQNSWLTLLRKSEIDKQEARMGHLRKALADAKTITADYVQLGTFYGSLLSVITDLDTLSAKAQATDLSGADAADQTLKTDVDKAISQDKAPGLPAAMDTLLQDLKALAADFGTLISAAKAGNSAGATAAEKALEADAAKIQAVDYTKIGSDIDAFYKPLMDDYNSEVDKANST